MKKLLLLFIFTSLTLFASEKVLLEKISLTFPSVDGMELVPADSRQFSYASSATPTTNRLVAMYTNKSLIEQIKKGTVYDLNEYILCQSFRMSESGRISKEEWEDKLSVMADNITATQKFLDYDALENELREDQKIEDALKMKITTGGPKLLEKLDVDDGVIHYTILLKYQPTPNDKALVLVGDANLLMVKNVIFYIYTYRFFEKLEDIRYVQEVGKDFVESFVDSND